MNGSWSPRAADSILKTGGGPPDLPRDSNEVADLIRSAHATIQKLRIVGGGTWLHGGRPVESTGTLHLSGLTGIVDYVPGDLTITARAGTTLRELHEAVSREGQWLPLDPIAHPHATLGATLATASTGPLGSTIGLPRDLALGLEVVTGEGEITRAGGRVVKNVAGFDLVRLHVGAWGTLGAITEATLRLRAKPNADVTLALRPRDGALADLLAALRSAPLNPVALEVFDEELSATHQLNGRCTVLIRLIGGETAVSSQRDVAHRLAETAEVDHALWLALSQPEPSNAFTVRASSRPSRFPLLWRSFDRARELGPLTLLGSPLRGVVRAVLPSPSLSQIQRVSETLSDVGARCIVEQCADHQLSPLRSSPLESRMRAAFDPAGILNRGAMGGDA